MHFELYEEMICIKDHYLSFKKILLLAIGLWSYERSKFAQYQFIFISDILMETIIFQVKNAFNRKLFVCYYIINIIIIAFAFVIIAIITEILFIKNIKYISLYYQIIIIEYLVSF